MKLRYTLFMWPTPILELFCDRLTNLYQASCSLRLCNRPWATSSGRWPKYATSIAATKRDLGIWPLTDILLKRYFILYDIKHCRPASLELRELHQCVWRVRSADSSAGMQLSQAVVSVSSYTASLVKILIASSWKFYHRCVFGQARYACH